MQITREQILYKLATAKPMLINQFGLKDMALFGSFARNEVNAKSDIDIMIDMNDKRFRIYCDLVDFLIGLFPGIEVQDVSRQAIKPAYFEHLKDDLLYV